MSEKSNPKQKADERWQQDEELWSGLMRKAQAGDEKSYKQLLEALSKALSSYLYTNFGKLISLEDCVQECLLAIHKARHTYNPKKSFRPWMFTIAKHRTIDIIRSQARHKNHESLDQSDYNDRIEYQSQSEEVAFSDIIDATSLLNQVSKDHQEILLLTPYKGMTAIEAADVLNISESAAKARLRRGIAAIQKVWLDAPC